MKQDENPSVFAHDYWSAYLFRMVLKLMLLKMFLKFSELALDWACVEKSDPKMKNKKGAYNRKNGIN